MSEREQAKQIIDTLPGDALPSLDFSALDEALQDFDTFVNSPNPL